MVLESDAHHRIDVTHHLLRVIVMVLESNSSGVTLTVASMRRTTSLHQATAARPSPAKGGSPDPTMTKGGISTPRALVYGT
jgi:hypothetical protein